jgi:hypothetical protein
MKILLLGAGLLVLFVLAGLLAFYRASQHVPEFYENALAVDPIDQQQASDELLQRATALVNDAKREGRWQTLFTAEQINGWLAVDLPINHPDTLPPELSDPRVAIEPDRVVLACRYGRDGNTCVLSLAVEPSLPERNLLALRILEARAGRVPLPIDELKAQTSQAASAAELPLSWQDVGGDPVAMLPWPAMFNRAQTVRIHVDTVRLGDGEIYIAGTTEPADAGR